MALLPIAKLGNPILREVARPVSAEESPMASFQHFIDDMIETMRKKDGVGLAAPQACRSIRAIVIESEENSRYPEAPNLSLLVMLNPVITFYSEEKVEGWEGCLSLDNLRGKVPRSASIHVEGFNRFMEPVSMDAEHFLAVVFQHEIDHLNGILFIDRMLDMTTLTHLDEYDRYWAHSEATPVGSVAS